MDIVTIQSDRNISCIDLTEADDEVEIITERIRPAKRRKREGKSSSRSPQINPSVPPPIVSPPSTQSIHRSDSPIVDLARSPSPSTSSKPSKIKVDVLVESVSNQKNIVENQGQEGVRFKVVKCPICLEEENKILAGGGEIVVTICGHIYCKSCLVQAIKTSHCCPNCRRKLTQRNFHRIFL